MAMTEIFKLSATKWKEMTKDDKKPFANMASQDKLRFKKQFDQSEIKLKETD